MFDGLYIVEDWDSDSFAMFKYFNDDWVYLRTLRKCELMDLSIVDLNIIDILMEYKSITLLSEKEFCDMGGHW